MGLIPILTRKKLSKGPAKFICNSRSSGFYFPSVELYASGSVIESYMRSGAILSSSGAATCSANGTYGFEIDFTNGTLPSGTSFARSSSATVWSSTGVMQTVSSDVARFDYDPSSLALKGLLIEPQRTNYILDSNFQNSSSWTVQFGASYTLNYAAGIDGVNNAARAQLPDANNAAIYNANLPSLAAETHTISVYGKATSTSSQSTYLFFWKNSYDTAHTSVSFSSAYSRQSATFTLPAAAAYQCGLLQVPYVSHPAADIIITAMQVEKGSIATSYIPTTTSSVTRAADQLSFTIPSGITQLTYTFDDNSTQTVTGLSAGSYTVPTNLNRAWIKRIQGAA